jgi:phospho-N-acetylmuramoyl-pentapeptide-transferase
MLLYLIHYLMPYYHPLRVFEYITFRAMIATITSFFIALLCSPIFIRHLKLHQIRQNIRKEGPLSHLKKSGTPTMGGMLILVSVLISVLLWADLNNAFIWISLLTMTAFGMIGYLDDVIKIKRCANLGLRAKWKYLLQTIFALLVAWLLYRHAVVPASTQLLVPFFKHIKIQLGAFFIVIAYFVLVGSSNAVNLTDGLDGLAILPAVLIAVALGIFAYVTGHFFFAEYLTIPFIPGTGELTILCGAIVGAGFGFLWFNTYPAQIFMGDVGALGLGATLGVIALIVRQEIVFFIMSGIFVLETFSVMLQVASFKLTGKRVFKMAPIHHHFELKGWPEPKIIVRFWIITCLLVLVGLMTLKLR